MPLHVTDQGSGDAILWIHGFPLSSRVFQPQLRVNGVRHVMPDLPGFGRSPAPDREMSMDDYAQAMLAVLDERQIERAYVAGLSMGGYIAFALARLAPERVRGLILIDTRETADTPEAKKGRFESIDKVKKEGVVPIVESMLPKMLTKNAPPEMVDDVRTMMSGSMASGVAAALRAMAERPDSTPMLAGLGIRVLIVVGEADAITPPADAQRMNRAIDGSKLVTIAGAAHLSNFERPEEFNKAVMLFVTQSA